MHERSRMLALLLVTLLFGGPAWTEPGNQPAEAPSVARGLLAALKDPNPRVVAEALLLLSERYMDEPGVRQQLQTSTRGTRLQECLKSDDQRVRLAAVSFLKTMGKEASAAVPLLLERLRDEDEEVRAAAAQALGAMGEEASAAVPQLMEWLRDKEGYVRAAAAQALGAMGEEASAAVPQLIERLRDEDIDVRAAAAQALGAMGEEASAAVPQLIERLRDEDIDVRAAAAHALAAMGEEASAAVPQLMERLRDDEWYVQGAAAHALAAMGKEASAAVPQLIERLRDDEGYVREAAARALGAMGKEASAAVPQLIERLRDDEWYVRKAAAEALGAMGKEASAAVPQLIERLRDKEEYVRDAAAQALGAMGKEASAAVPQLIERLRDEEASVRAAAAQALEAMGNSDVRAAAAQALGAMGEEASAAVPQLMEWLRDKEGYVRAAAAQALGAMGKEASAAVPLLLERLRDEDIDVRAAAAQALGAMGKEASAAVPQLIERLRDNEGYVRAAAAQALGAMGKEASAAVPLLLERLRDNEGSVQAAAAQALGAMGKEASVAVPLLFEWLQMNYKFKDNIKQDPLLVCLDVLPPPDFQTIALALAKASDASSAEQFIWLLLAHASGGSDPRAERVLRWLLRASEEIPSQLSADEARATVQAFAEFWLFTESHPKLRRLVAEQIAEVVSRNRSRWESTDIELLEFHIKNLQEKYPTQTGTLRTAVASIKQQGLLEKFGWGGAAHVGFWVLLIFFYPRSAKVQAFFFWNPWVRNIAGFGYVGPLLTWVPFLRRRLLSPFQERLRKVAELESFSISAYFADSEVTAPPSPKRQRLLEVLPRLRGQVVLEGASGLGKSMFLKYLFSQSRNLAVYLSAEQCKDGVLKAIQNLLEGQARDETFLQSLIYSGGLDIYIDGLNEVSADTRARIIQFVEQHFRGNMLLATQPMEWKPPVGVKRYVLQPLSEEQIARFLESREPVLGEGVPLRGAAYQQECQRFVAKALSAQQPVELRQANAEVLSNPLDLTVVAQMLAEQRPPDLFRLRQQQYELMARDYRERHGGDFPLKEFSEEAYKMRLESRSTLPEERFDGELLRLQEVKMVLCHRWRSPDGSERREWHFRHDKIQEFFIAQTFLGPNNPRTTEHFGDPRFRGVYLLLALLLEPEQAQALRDLLVEHAAESKDHSVSDDFVTLLKKRQGADKVRAATSKGAA